MGLRGSITCAVPCTPPRRRGWAALALAASCLATLGAGCSQDAADEGRATSTTVADGPSSALAVPPIRIVDPGPIDQVAPADPERGTRRGSPLDDLPAGTRLLVDFGQRPTWSPDGSTIAFLDDSPLGDGWTVDVERGTATELTGQLDQRFTRAQYLSNGDLLLCGPTSGPEPTPEHPEAGRFTAVMFLLRAPFDGSAEPLGVPCWEGIATSSDSMRIAWNRSDIDYTDTDLASRVINGITEVWTGEIVDVDGRAAVVDARPVLDRDTFGSLAVFEVQGFRPPDDDELIVTAYAYQGGEVLGVDLTTGDVRNYSNSSAYEEAEGVDPSGDSVLVERDLEYSGVEPGPLDIWRLDLHDRRWERITTFNRWAPFYASNPAVSPDGETMAFQLSIDGDVEGRGDGILLQQLSP
ncbi:MAG: PD40 domain-containing protein [Actinobacteria bacterium]|nr:PD40 domain-containing protein [Actinomycetota bacterium]